MVVKRLEGQEFFLRVRSLTKLFGYGWYRHHSILLQGQAGFVQTSDLGEEGVIIRPKCLSALYVE
jgi:hypothetical protein